jgi:hypothetical protein
MDSVDHLSSFPASTHTHIFGNHSNGDGHLKTADVRSFMDCRKTASSTASKLGFDFGNDENYDFIFKIVNLLIGLGSLRICTHDLTILTKTKDNDPRLQIVSIVLTKVSIPAEVG